MTGLKDKVKVLLIRGHRLKPMDGTRTGQLVYINQGKKPGWLVPREAQPGIWEDPKPTKKPMDVYPVVEGEICVRTIEPPEITNNLDPNDLAGPIYKNPLRILAADNVVGNVLLRSLINRGLAHRIFVGATLGVLSIILWGHGYIYGLMTGRPDLFTNLIFVFAFMGVMVGIFLYVLLIEMR